MSADVGDALLVFCLGSSLRLLRGERENGCILPFTKSRQQHGLAIGELERVMIDVKRALVDLAKDRNGVPGFYERSARIGTSPASRRRVRYQEGGKQQANNLPARRTLVCQCRNHV